jgi:uncharacterized protein (DUF2225 family)
VAPELSKIEAGVAEIVRSDEYQAQRGNPEFPELANRFLCYSLLHAKRDDFASAAFTALRAAWACDDEGKTEQARQCRLQAARHMEKARQNGQSISESPKSATEEALLTDILRRAGEFEQAAAVAHEGLNRQAEETVAKVIQYQLRLIDQQDTACYTVEKAVQETREKPQGKRSFFSWRRS